jgi:hypothetical protein
MAELLEILGDDIARLNDADLRELIGLLCEADYRRAERSTRVITWGGNQDARDGGLDVVVRDQTPPPTNSFVPRSITGFQVKKPDMPKAKILDEMRKNGVLREEIKRLISAKGAYIIVSSSGSTSDAALKSRVEAMKEAVADESGSENLHLDFYDRGRIATWVREHPSLILGVRSKIGRPLTGWRSYENWAHAPGGKDEEYLSDDELRLHDDTRDHEPGLSIVDGLLKLRTALQTAGPSVRLTGLSGVGKTRLVQALFDPRVGEHALNPTQVFYTDIALGPVPDPCNFADQLIAARTKAFLIVDNCPPELHRQLTVMCSKPESTVSLLTIEYDVRDDLPEETSVFRLKPASGQIIERLISKRYPHIGQVDARSIAEFSGGNARLAIALANTVQHGETVSRLRDEELFKRLFWQRHQPTQSLLKSAEVLSLLYSFDGVSVSEDSELQVLASLLGKSAAELYSDVAELKNRDLVQARGIWRAVLPHAVANRLAKRALESIPKTTVVTKILTSGSDRLIKSFTRRLSFLHDSDVAKEIVRDWLKDAGWIGQSLRNLSDLEIAVLRNVAPVATEETLDALERVANGPNGELFTSRENSHYAEFVRLLRHLAYDAALFDRSVRLICRFALSEDRDENNNSTREVLKSLFYIYLSGTHAPLEARVKIIEELLESQNQDRQSLGRILLDGALEAWHFSSHHQFEFGARLRDYGYEPTTREEIAAWYESFIDICTHVAVSEHPLAREVRKLLANNFRGLWTRAGMFNVLEKSARQIHEKGGWNDGWIAVRETLRYDGQRMVDALRQRLIQLGKLLKPIDLLQRARVFALSDGYRDIDLADDLPDDSDGSVIYHKAEETTRRIGAEVAQNPEMLTTLLPELVSSRGSRLPAFGSGLSDGCKDKDKMFQMIVAEAKKDISRGAESQRSLRISPCVRSE